MMKSGRNITASTAMTSRPRADNRAAPIGATGIGRHGAKKRWFDEGHSRAMPRPPSVSVSSRPWLAVTRPPTIAIRTAPAP